MTKIIRKWLFVRIFVLILGAFFLLAGTNGGGWVGNRGEKESAEAHRISESASLEKADASLARDFAELKFSYKKRKNFRGSAPKRTVLASQQAVYESVGELKKRISVPFDIQVVFVECGGPDSYYDDNTHEIIICYELIDAYYGLFSRTLRAQAARDEAANGAIVSMFLHEVAHALIAGWDLPITGREEDAADQFSTLLLIDGMANGDQLALDGARSFKLLADLERDLEKDYSDPHSLDEQRFFNTMCLVYGHRPEQYEYLIRSGQLPVERAFECEADYARLNKSWQRLLAPHLVPSYRRQGFNSGAHSDKPH